MGLIEPATVALLFSGLFTGYLAASMDRPRKGLPLNGWFALSAAFFISGTVLLFAA